MENLFEKLELSLYAKPNEIKRAYYKKVREFPNEQYPEEFKYYRTIYEQLQDEAVRLRLQQKYQSPALKKMVAQVKAFQKEKKCKEALVEVKRFLLDYEKTPEVVFYQVLLNCDLDQLDQALIHWDELAQFEYKEKEYHMLQKAYTSSLVRQDKQDELTRYLQQIEEENQSNYSWHKGILLKVYMKTHSLEEIMVYYRSCFLNPDQSFEDLIKVIPHLARKYREAAPGQLSPQQELDLGSIIYGYIPYLVQEKKRYASVLKQVTHLYKQENDATLAQLYAGLFNVLRIISDMDLAKISTILPDIAAPVNPIMAIHSGKEQEVSVKKYLLTQMEQLSSRISSHPVIEEVDQAQLEAINQHIQELNQAHLKKTLLEEQVQQKNEQDEIEERQSSSVQQKTEQKAEQRNEPPKVQSTSWAKRFDEKHTPRLDRWEQKLTRVTARGSKVRRGNLVAVILIFVLAMALTNSLSLSIGVAVVYYFFYRKVHQVGRIAFNLFVIYILIRLFMRFL